MKRYLVIVWVATMCGVGYADTKTEAPTARDCAAAYFEALMRGDTERANALVGVPFSFDRKEILKTKEAVEKKHQAIAAKKGKRNVPQYTVSVPKNPPSLDRTTFPEYEVFRITIAEGNEHIDVYVTRGAAPKVIGFSD